MNLTMIISLISASGFSIAVAVLVNRRHNVYFSTGTIIPLVLSILIYDFIVVSNFLEHSGITDYFDPIEDIAEIVFTFMFLLFVNNWRKDRSEAHFRDLFKLAPLPLAEAAMDGQIKEVNDALAQKLYEFYGITIDNLQTFEKWWEMAYPDPKYREYAISTWRKGVAHALETDGILNPLEREITCKDGTKRTVILGGRVIGEKLLVSFFDITDRKQVEDEKEKMRVQMLQTQKLEAVGMLAGGVAHDFNNTLGAVMGYAELTLEDMDPENEFYDNLCQILNATRRSTGLTRQLLAFARKQSVMPTIFDVNMEIEDTIKMLRRLIRENIELKWFPGEGPLNVRLDPSQFDQILANLCVNAKDAIAEVGKISVETKRVAIGEDYIKLHAECAPGDYVLLSFSDTGCGMDNETLEHIFEPFYTTKSTGKGTGLGLSTVYGIIRQNNGMIDVYSEPGIGTTFNIYLPWYSKQDDAVTTGEDEKLPGSQGETILIVEDDPLILEMGIAMLKRLGYAVSDADTPQKAIRMAEDKTTEMQLLITDLVMPEMNGLDLSKHLLEKRPGMKTLYMSGYSANIIDFESVQGNGLNFIRKPFSLKDIAFKIREVLDGYSSSDLI